jgi:fatty acid desaturase
MMREWNGWLRLAALANFAIAITHVAIGAIGAPAYLFFGSLEMAQMAQEGSLLLAAVTLALAVAFAVFGLYALSGAGAIRALPLLAPALYGIGVLYTLRGLIVVLDVLRLLRGADYPPQQTVFSAVALAIGLAYLIGAARRG